MSGAEKNYENAIKRFLKSEGIYPLGVSSKDITVKPCGYYTKRHGNVFTTNGLPDLQVVVNGKCVDLEVKAENGKPSEVQIAIVSQINDCGGIAHVVYPKDFDFIKSLILGLKK